MGPQGSRWRQHGTQHIPMSSRSGRDLLKPPSRMSGSSLTAGPQGSSNPRRPLQTTVEDHRSREGSRGPSHSVQASPEDHRSEERARVFAAWHGMRAPEQSSRVLSEPRESSVPSETRKLSVPSETTKPKPPSNIASSTTSNRERRNRATVVIHNPSGPIYDPHTSSSVKDDAHTG